MHAELLAFLNLNESIWIIIIIIIFFFFFFFFFCDTLCLVFSLVSSVGQRASDGVQSP